MVLGPLGITCNAVGPSPIRTDLIRNVPEEKLQEIIDLVNLHEVEIVIFNHALAPSQERNLEARLKCQVLDRSGLILDIFAVKWLSAWQRQNL